MPREFFHVYHDDLTSIKHLSDAERGRLFTALLEYSITGTEPDLRGNERILFPTFANRIRREAAAYDEKCAKLKSNGSKRKQKEAFDSKRKQKEAFDSICAQEEEEDEEEDEDINAHAHARARDVLALFRSICVSLPPAHDLTPERVKNINELLQTGVDLDECRKVFERVERSDFLTGRNGKSWRAAFDWLIKPQNWQKVTEGNYDNREEAAVDGRYAPTYDLAEIEQMLDDEWQEGLDEEGGKE